MMTKDKTVTMSRELLKEVEDLLACPQSHVRSEYIKAYKAIGEILATPVVERQAVLCFKHLKGSECKSDGRTYDVMFYPMEGYQPLFDSPPAPVAVPDGWKLVPITPTPEMVEALKARLMVTSRGGILSAGVSLADAIAAAPCLDKLKELNK